MRLRKPVDPRLALPLLLLLVPLFTAASHPQSDPCLDAITLQESDVARLKMPSKFSHLTPPWERTDGKHAKVIRSEGLTYQWSWMKALRVTGLFKTVEDIIGFLSANDCLFVPVGSFVRNILLQKKAVYVSGEVSCKLHELYSKCVATYGSSNCALYPIEDGGWGAYRLEIGDSSSNRSTYSVKAEPIVLHEWRSVLGAPRNRWRFTVDTLAIFDYGVGDVFVIDPTESGWKHVCDKKLVPAMGDWEEWSQNQTEKLLGFYDLRTDGFASQSENFQKFVNNEISTAEKRVSQKFYCEHVLKGVSNLEGTTPVCHTTYPEKESAKKISQMRTVMIGEMGIHWNSTVGKAADDLEAVFCTPRQFADIRARLLHKVAAPADSVHSEPSPKVIEEGLPMVNDSANVHVRPILEKNEPVPLLPAEYPSVPRARPNKNLEFEADHLLVSGAGKEPELVYFEGSNRAPEGPDKDSEEEDEEEKETEPIRVIGGVAADPNEDPAYKHHNAIPDDTPVMRFDKVEEGGISEAAAAMEISTSSATKQAVFFSSFLLFLIV
ncbi:unnamed protein product [Caenorhabditis sp. 36 PRJEB53466]|nr:unnamed protein product [Caenorhabditis sp. 36 PRJEB53466]